MTGTEYPDPLWTPDNPPRSVEAYIEAHWEFDPDRIVSGYPYSGAKWSDWFESTPKPDRWGIPDRSLGIAWKPHHDDIHNGLTADPLAVAELLSEERDIERSSAMPGGIGAGGQTFRIPLLDGGLFVDFKQWEEELTNRIRASQTTLIDGPMALRVLLEALGFEGPSRKLKGEKKRPDIEEIRRIVTDRVEEHRRNYGE